MWRSMWSEPADGDASPPRHFWLDAGISCLLFAIALVKAGAVVLTFLISRLLATRHWAVFGAPLSVVYWGR